MLRLNAQIWYTDTVYVDWSLIACIYINIYQMVILCVFDCSSAVSCEKDLNPYTVLLLSDCVCVCVCQTACKYWIKALLCFNNPFQYQACLFICSFVHVYSLSYYFTDANSGADGCFQGPEAVGLCWSRCVSSSCSRESDLDTYRYWWMCSVSGFKLFPSPPENVTFSSNQAFKRSLTET